MYCELKKINTNTSLHVIYARTTLNKNLMMLDIFFPDFQKIQKYLLLTVMVSQSHSIKSHDPESISISQCGNIQTRHIIYKTAGAAVMSQISASHNIFLSDTVQLFRKILICGFLIDVSFKASQHPQRYGFPRGHQSFFNHLVLKT